MENSVFSQPRVVQRFEQMVLAKLYTDRGTPEDARNQQFQQERFGTLALPHYVILAPTGETLAELAGSTSESRFVEFLDSGLARWVSLRESPAESDQVWQAFDLERVLERMDSGRSLVVDWTADW